MSMDLVHHDVVHVHGTDEHADAHSVGESSSMTHQRQRSRSHCQKCLLCARHSDTAWFGLNDIAVM